MHLKPKPRDLRQETVVTELPLRKDTGSVAQPAIWSGRILSGVIGTFLAMEGLTRLLTGRALVAPSEAARMLDPPFQAGLGTALVGGVLLLAFSRTRLAGGVLLTLCVSGLLTVEARAAVPSISHILFWAYVGVLMVAGLALRRGGRSRSSPSPY